MRYERPTIIRRDSIIGLAAAAPSDIPADGTGVSDVYKKDNVVPVVWAGEVVAYETPAVSRRDSIAGLAGTRPSDLPPKSSDVNVKDNIVPVRW